MNAVWYLWWTTHEPATVPPAYDPAKANPTAFPIVVTFALKISYWLVLVLCTCRWRLASTKIEVFPGELPSFRRLQQTHPKQDARGQGEMAAVNQSALWWWQLFPFEVVSRDPGLETCFYFWEDRGGGGQFCRPAEHHRGSSFTECSHSGRNGLRPTFLLYAAYGNAMYSKTLHWLSHHKPLQQVRAALQDLTSIHAHVSNFPWHITP